MTFKSFNMIEEPERFYEKDYLKKYDVCPALCMQVQTIPENKKMWKDGDLPKKTGEYLVYRISGYGSKSIDLIQYNVSRHFWCVDCQNEVIAWKEIVLPKENE